MNFQLKLLCSVCLSSILGACAFGNGMICGPQTALADCNKEVYEKLVHPKAYGEHWIKAGMTKESWREDWVACGGRPSGDYSSEAPDGSTTAVIQADSKRTSKRLGSCMQSKGYEYHYTGIGASEKKQK